VSAGPDLASRKVELWSTAMSSEPDTYEVAARVATIPDAAAAVVRFANSAYVGAVYPVGTVLEAVIRVGCRTVGALAMASLNRELVDTWGAPELWEESLVIGRAAKLIGRLLSFSRSDTELLFVAGLFSCAGTAGLLMQDEGYLRWRRAQATKKLGDLDVLRRETMVYGQSHVDVSSRLLAEWNMPTELVETVAAHHDPETTMERALWAAMASLFDDSDARCLQVRFGAAMKEIGLADHVGFVESEARLFADATVQVFAERMSPEMDIASQW
jgi:HD-like signal output (HDOD) protein